MLQVIEGTPVYVVEFTEMPELPIHGLTEEEAKYETVLDRLVGNRNGLLSQRRHTGNYALALNNAIESGIIDQPGKYGIYIYHAKDGEMRYEIFSIIEDTLRKV